MADVDVVMHRALHTTAQWVCRWPEAGCGKAMRHKLNCGCGAMRALAANAETIKANIKSDVYLGGRARELGVDLCLWRARWQRVRRGTPPGRCLFLDERRLFVSPRRLLDTRFGAVVLGFGHD